MTELVKIQEELNVQLANKEIVGALVATTFKGLNEATMRKAALEGMMRGFEFKDFLEKNVYAIPFNGGYSLVTSVDYARKIGAKSGVIGKSKPIYHDDPNSGKVVSCEITIHKKGGHPDGYTAEVYFNEYYKAGKNGYPSLWDSKPRTMIAKVAEMHALRMACPEELSQSYIEEEMTHGVIVEDKKIAPVSPKGKITFLLKKLGADISSKEATIESIKSLTDLDVIEENFEEIITRLEIKVNEKNENN